MKRKLGSVIAVAGFVLVGGLAVVAPAHATPTQTAAPAAAHRGYKVLAVLHADDSKATNIKRGSALVNGVMIANVVTSKDCPVQNASPMENPLGFADSKIFLAMSWHAQLTASGRPEAMMQLGNSAFVKSNHTDGYSFYVTDGVWYDFIHEPTVGSNWFAWHHQASFAATFLVQGGGINNVGIHVNSDGTVSSPWGMVSGGLAGNKFRQLIENYGSSTPTYSVTLADKGNHSLKEQTRFLVEPARDGSGNVLCGNLFVVLP